MPRVEQYQEGLHDISYLVRAEEMRRNTWVGDGKLVGCETD